MERVADRVGGGMGTWIGEQGWKGENGVMATGGEGENRWNGGTEIKKAGEDKREKNVAYCQNCSQHLLKCTNHGCKWNRLLSVFLFVV